MATPNPLPNAAQAPQVLSKTFTIAGILTDVYGLDNLPIGLKSITTLWLLHPRLLDKQVMERIASTCIHDWNLRDSCDRGLLCVAFDQRNHGSRTVNPLANESWKDKNETHAQDMFRQGLADVASVFFNADWNSIFHGTALDTSLLMDHLGSYIFHDKEGPVIDQHMVLGVSLGGHAAWQMFFSEPRVTAAIVIIGCPDYMRVMTDRAKLSKLETYTKSDGADFLESKDFPKALIASVKKWDPKGLLFGTSEIEADPTESEQSRLREILDTKIKGKQLLVCSGGADKLVPYHCSEPFMRFLKNATSGGWYKDGNVYVEDNVYPGIGHTYSEVMIKDTTRFVSDVLAGRSSRPASKI